jgi:hypothetical protein
VCQSVNDSQPATAPSSSRTHSGRRSGLWLSNHGRRASVLTGSRSAVDIRAGIEAL